MGSESSKSESNCSKSDSYSSSNSGKKKNKLEIMNCLKENENTMINRVWIVKKSISLSEDHVALPLIERLVFPLYFKLSDKDISNLHNIHKPKTNVFKIENEFKSKFKHWAIILELSNETYVNIQFGREGFSLEEFNKTDVEGEAALNSIISTWGEDGHPFSFCYLGFANYEYDKLKKILVDKKNKEKKSFEEKRVTYYNACSYNCQHFACDIEKILFGYIQVWHSFDYYLNQFYEHFFRDIEIGRASCRERV